MRADDEHCSITRTHDRGSSDATLWLQAIVDNSDDAIVSKTLDGTITSWNAGAARLFGYTAEEAIGQQIMLIVPSERQKEEAEILAKMSRGERIVNFETERRHKNGQLIDVSVTVSAVRASDGRIIGASKIARDISARKRAAERRELLLGEMHHRIKNLFATTIALVRLSARTAADATSLADDLIGRLEALNRVHQLTLPDGLLPKLEQPSTLIALINAIVLPHQIADVERITVTGEDVALAPPMLSGLALLLHELTTNAVKHGALRYGGGKINITIGWEEEIAHLIWRETGSQPVRREPQVGFGSRLEAALIKSLGGKIERQWHDEGISVLIRFPVHNTKAT